MDELHTLIIALGEFRKLFVSSLINELKYAKRLNDDDLLTAEHMDRLHNQIRNMNMAVAKITSVWEKINNERISKHHAPALTRQPEASNGVYDSKSPLQSS